MQNSDILTPKKAVNFKFISSLLFINLTNPLDPSLPSPVHLHFLPDEGSDHHLGDCCSSSNLYFSGIVICGF